MKDDTPRPPGPTPLGLGRNGRRRRREMAMSSRVVRSVACVAGLLIDALVLLSAVWSRPPLWLLLEGAALSALCVYGLYSTWAWTRTD